MADATVTGSKKSRQDLDDTGRAFLDSERPNDPSAARLWDFAHRGMQITAERERLAAERGALVDTAASAPETVAELTHLRQQPREARLRTAARDLNGLGEESGFTSYVMTAGKEFPSLLTRLPIFRPSQRRTQQSIQDTDNAVAFDTPFGRGRRLGPPLTVRDEDTLIALMRLRDRAIIGPQRKLPAEIRDIYQPGSGTAEIHRVVCTIDQVVEELELTDSGTNFRNTLASIKRLGAARIELERRDSHDDSMIGGMFDLVKVQWRTYEAHGLVDVVFPPLMASWLRHSYTYIDWGTRLKLSPLAKAIHRYLSGQRREYEIDLKKLGAIIGYDGRTEHMRTKFSKALDELVRQRWLESYRIHGTGRSLAPWKLSVVRQGSGTS